MRLWHKDLIPLLPRQQLLGQHRECCALRGKGWGKKHSTVDYVWQYGYKSLFNYHTFVIKEMDKRKYKVGYDWYISEYRGLRLGFDFTGFTHSTLETVDTYPEHNQAYYQECLDNLKAKGVLFHER